MTVAVWELAAALPAIREVVLWSHEVLLTADDEPFDKLEAALAALDARLAETDSGDGLESPSGVEGDGA